MRIEAVSLQNFRNIELARLRFGEQPVFVVGPNGQGKTNLLEALSLITALRSFRTNENRALIRWQHREARVIYEIEHEELGASRLEFRLASGKKSILLDETPLTRLADLIGRFPTVALSSHDIQLLRGAPALRRRFLDMTLSGADSHYFTALRHYTRALKERNALLKKGRDTPELGAFDAVVAGAGAEVMRHRAAAIGVLRPLLVTAYNSIATQPEEPELTYEPDLDAADKDAFIEILRSNRQRDLTMQTTLRGPHRDDIRLGLKHHDAREFASEGQQRALVLSLRIAEARWMKERTGITPVLLADDILGELDPERRSAFWKCLEQAQQIIATGTQPPSGSPSGSWQYLHVEAGSFREK